MVRKARGKAYPLVPEGWSMAAISIRTEQELVTRLLSGPGTREFRESRLAPKVARERQARALLEEAEGRYTADSLNHLFDTVDHEELTGRPWFGQLLRELDRGILPKMTRRSRGEVD